MSDRQPIDVTIRIETPADRDDIYRLNQSAFGQDDEAELVEALRDCGHAKLSLVAERDGRIVGHILFSDLQIVSPSRSVSALALAPMAVLPAYQRQGIGSQLVRRGLDHCRAVGARIVIVVGHPEYYPRFGFSAELAARLDCEYAGEAFMALELAPGAMAGVTGQVVYSAPFREL